MIAEPLEFLKGQTSALYWANLAATEDIVINQGGSWSGKTYSIMQVLFTIAIMRPEYIITVTTNTVTKLKEDALRISKDIVFKNPIIRERYLLPGLQWYNSTDRVYNFINGSIIEFKSFEDEEQAKGGKRHILYVNEASRVRYMVFFEAELRTSVRTFVDYNPTSQFYIHDKVINNKLEYPSVKVIRSWHIHNPFLDQKQRDRLERIQDPELWKVYARGLTGILKGTIFPNWGEVDAFPVFRETIIWYLDWGYTNDPTAGGRIAINPVDEKNKPLPYDFIADEFCYTPGISPAAIKQLIEAKGYQEGQLLYCDWDVSQVKQLRALGITAIPFLKPEGVVLSRILFVKNKRVAYTTKSENIREETKRYKFLEVDDKITNTPVGEWNHHMDGITSAYHTHCLRAGIL